MFICASVLSADFARLGEEVVRFENAHVDRLHIDIMDGMFVPNFSMGPKIVAAINRTTNLFLSVHLMVYSPFEHIESFVEAGADQITFHFEATEDIEETLEFIKKCGVRAGIALRPETPASFIPRYLPLLDEILIMTVNPGFGGQKLLPNTLRKIEEVRSYVDQFYESEKENFPDVAVDGGVNDQTVSLCAQHGANVLVSGSYLCESKDMGAEVLHLKEIAKQSYMK